MKHPPIDWASMTDAELVKAAETQIWLSAFASNNPRAPAHLETDRASDETRNRNKPWLYKQAWNAAYRSCGYAPSDADIAAAREPDPPEESQS